VDDFQHIGEMPCVRNSLMSGIASGAGIGIIRSMTLRTSMFGAAYWAAFFLRYFFRQNWSAALGVWHVHSYLYRDLVRTFVT
jgi:glycerol kinase